MATKAHALPPTFRSLYRLFLRTTSASVLHHRGATRNLRRLWRPSFTDAAQVINQLQHDNIDGPSRALMENWLKVWDKRVDNTLSLLYTSSISRGLPHKLTRNLAFLRRDELRRVYSEILPKWNPQLPPTSAAYQIPPPPTEKQKNKDVKRERYDAMDRSAWNALGQVVKLAEGRQGIVLGRILSGRRKAKTI